MAEFAEVMKQALRMCNELSCEDCPLADVFEVCPIGDTSFNTGLASMGKLVMNWAAENPEPRYPTWKEWHKANFPTASHSLGPCRFVNVEEAGCGFNNGCVECINRPIPAEIAEKLGIKPIGGRDDG